MTVSADNITLRDLGKEQLWIAAREMRNLRALRSKITMVEVHYAGWESTTAISAGYLLRCGNDLAGLTIAS